MVYFHLQPCNPFNYSVFWSRFFLHHKNPSLSLSKYIYIYSLHAQFRAPFRAPLSTTTGVVFRHYRRPFRASFRCYSKRRCRHHLRRSKRAIFGVFWGCNFSNCRSHIQGLFIAAAGARFKHCKCPFRAPFSTIQSTIQPSFQACEWGNRAALRWMQPIPLAMAWMALLGMKQSTGG